MEAHFIALLLTPPPFPARPARFILPLSLGPSRLDEPTTATATTTTTTTTESRCPPATRPPQPPTASESKVTLSGDTACRRPPDLLRPADHSARLGCHDNHGGHNGHDDDDAAATTTTTTTTSPVNPGPLEPHRPPPLKRARPEPALVAMPSAPLRSPGNSASPLPRQHRHQTQPQPLRASPSEYSCRQPAFFSSPPAHASLHSFPPAGQSPSVQPPDLALTTTVAAANYASATASSSPSSGTHTLCRGGQSVLAELDVKPQLTTNGTGDLAFRARATPSPLSQAPGNLLLCHQARIENGLSGFVLGQEGQMVGSGASGRQEMMDPESGDDLLSGPGDYETRHGNNSAAAGGAGGGMAGGVGGGGMITGLPVDGASGGGHLTSLNEESMMVLSQSIDSIHTVGTNGGLDGMEVRRPSGRFFSRILWPIKARRLGPLCTSLAIGCPPLL
ncbi:unnamed protein product [Protopolystoma xenopodis]|uniref:Uncharacterized protein n=1 Tax=Protopolystoma xenopodis TaxID=117903 RepID=A0A3S5B162_9PLAT|nr:unnamed protein product [Protopolystoma xenopodis]